MKIVHKIQPNNRTCVHTCLSMITGEPIDNLISRFGDDGLGFNETATHLVEYGLFPINTTGTPHQFSLAGVYLVAACSKNLKGKQHQIVVEASAEGYTVYDPQYGREGMEYWSAVELVNGSMPITEVLYLDPEPLKMMQNKKPIRHD